MIKKKAKLLLLLAVLQTLYYCVLYYFDLDWYRGYVEVVTLPLLIACYIVESMVKSRLYILSLVFVLIGDIIDTFFHEIYDLAIVCFTINLAFYSYYVLKYLKDYKPKTMIWVSIIYLILYLIIFISLSRNMTGLSLENVLIYNFFLGIFSICSWILFICDRNYINFLLMMASLSIIGISCLYLYVEFIKYSKIVDFFIINLLFLSFHVSMLLYVIQKEKTLKPI